MKRMTRIFKPDGKTVIIAMDHGMGMNVNPALDETEATLKAIVRGGADAVLTTFGIMQKYGEILQDVAVILRADGGERQLRDHRAMLYSLYAGADHPGSSAGHGSRF